jgi:TonB-linked SusC/RagA family outer membrane protein
MKKFLIFTLLLSFAQLIFAQSIAVTGNVTDASDKSALPGVTVIIKGATTGTVTDFDGNFDITANKGDVLVFSSIGYETVEKTVSSDVLNLSMSSDSKILDEVVAVGYGTMKKSDLTGSVASIKAEQLKKTPVANLDQALQGRAAGVTVNSNSGQPGKAAEVRIRGIGTVNEASPLYVVDGVMVNDIKFLSPSDIESTEILKDASATAIYGSRGANGVILVSTKKGKNGESNISFDAYWGIQNRWRKLDLMGKDEFVQTMVSMSNDRDLKEFFNENGFADWLKVFKMRNSPYFPVNFDYENQNTDWQNEVFNPNALIHSYSLAINGGKDNFTYAISGNYFNQDGTIIGSNFERLSLRLNTSYQARPWLKVGENLSFSTSKERNAMNNNSSPGASMLSAALAMAPWDPTHYPEGAVNIDGKDLSGQIAASSNNKNVTNPFSMIENSVPTSNTERWVGDVYLEITPIKNLVFRSDLSIDLSNNRDKTVWLGPYKYSNYDYRDKNSMTSGMSRYFTLMNENTLTYSFEKNKHSFTAMAGQTIEQYNYNSVSGSGAKILNLIENNYYLSQTTEERSVGDEVARSRRFSLLGRLHYSYASRYLITVNFRADASSKFPEHLWGYFPSVALAWRVSEESFLKNFNKLDNLKLRFGWGQIGNDKIRDDSFLLKVFNTGPTFSDYSFNGITQSGATVLTWINRGGKWETTEQLNIGVDFGFWKGLLSGTLELYQRDTKEMLLGVKAPAFVGNRYDATKNVGTVRNRGIELSLEHTKRLKKFSYTIGGNVSFVKNELTALNGGNPVIWSYQRSDVGLPLFSFWGYKYEGIYKDDTEAWAHLFYYDDTDKLPYHAGDAKFADLNNDGKIDNDDKTNIGNPFPWLTYGLNFSAEFFGFDVQCFFQGVYGNQIYNALRERTESKGTGSALSTSMRNVWTPTHQEGTIPNPYGNSNNSAVSSRFIENGAYFRFKNIQIGYTVPKHHTQKAKISKLRFYVSANNLFTLTKYTGYDPEVGDGVDYGNYPQSRTFTFGVNIIL